METSMVRKRIRRERTICTRTGLKWHWETDSAMHEAVAAIAGCGVSPIVRIAANEGWMVKSRSIRPSILGCWLILLIAHRSSGLGRPRNNRAASLHCRRRKKTCQLCQIPSTRAKRIRFAISNGKVWHLHNNRIPATGK